MDFQFKHCFTGPLEDDPEPPVFSLEVPAGLSLCHAAQHQVQLLDRRQLQQEDHPQLHAASKLQLPARVRGQEEQLGRLEGKEVVVTAAG